MSTRLTPAKRKAEALALLESPQISALFEKVRLASGPPIEPAPRKPNPLPAAIGIGLLCALAWWSCGGLRSGALRATLPSGQAANTAIGDTCLYRGEFFPSSGIPTLRQLEVLKTGANVDSGASPAVRGIAFAVLANWFTVAFDAYYAPLALNLVLCCLGAWLVMRATSVLFADRTKALLAATCFSLSIVLTASVGEFGPRLLGICCFYLWTLLLVSMDAEDAPLTVRRALGLAALAGLWSLVDSSSLAGIAIFGVFAVRRRRVWPFVLAAVSWCLLPLAVESVWRRLGLAVEWTPDLARIGAALQQHGSRLAADPLGYLGYLTIEFGNLIFAENPLAVVICLVGLGLVPHKSKWLLRACFVAPILVQLVLLPTTRDRGAAIAGNTIVVFVLVSHYAVELGRRLQARFGAEAFAVPLVGLAALQGAWGYAGLWGWDFPASAFASGAFREAGTLTPTRYARLSGSPQEVPTVLGGPVRGDRICGVFKDQARPPVYRVARVPNLASLAGWPSLRRLLAVQAPVLAALLVAIVCLMRFRRGLATATLFAGCAAAALLCGSAGGFAPRALASFEGRIAVQEDEKLVGAVHLSPEFQECLQDAAGRDEQVELFVRLRAVNAEAEHAVEFQVAEWSSVQPRLAVPARALLEAVRARGGRLEFSISPASASKGLLVHSWQPMRANGERSAFVVHADGSQAPLERFPSFEIRVVRAARPFAFQKLFERFEPSQPASYALVGF
jgi:hypothetical protein